MSFNEYTLVSGICIGLLTLNSNISIIQTLLRGPFFCMVNTKKDFFHIIFLTVLLTLQM